MKEAVAQLGSVATLKSFRCPITRSHLHIAYILYELKNDKSSLSDLPILGILIVNMIFHAIFGCNSTVEVLFLVRALGLIYAQGGLDVMIIGCHCSFIH